MAKSEIRKRGNKFEAMVHVLIIKDDDTYTSFCPELNLSSYGETISDAKEGFEEALALFLKETDRKKTLNSELLKLGWTVRVLPHPLYVPPMHSDSLMQMYPGTQKTIQERISIPVPVW